MKFGNIKERGEYYRSLTDYRLMPNAPVIIMLDGRSFSTFTKHTFERPFDGYFMDMMDSTAKYLCENISGAKIAYVQSDEISIMVTDYQNDNTDTFFKNRLTKLCSICASMATSHFMKRLMKFLYDCGCYSDRTEDEVESLFDDIPEIQFDCKAWNVPTTDDAYLWFLYRNRDCIRNSVQQAAQTFLSHKELTGLNVEEQAALLKEKKGIDWENGFTYGEKYGRIVIPYEEEVESGRIKKVWTIAGNREKPYIGITKYTFDRLSKGEYISNEVIPKYDIELARILKEEGFDGNFRLVMRKIEDAVEGEPKYSGVFVNPGDYNPETDIPLPSEREILLWYVRTMNCARRSHED